LSPHVVVELEKLRKAIKALNREFHNDRHNNRYLVSRNKREGHNPRRKKK
jgi:hypothetical protein